MAYNDTHKYKERERERERDKKQLYRWIGLAVGIVLGLVVLVLYSQWVKKSAVVRAQKRIGESGFMKAKQKWEVKNPINSRQMAEKYERNLDFMKS